MTIATNIANTATERPIITGFLSAADEDTFGNTSIVKMVEMLLVIDANDETMAASNAAKTNPLIPIGNIVIACG